MGSTACSGCAAPREREELRALIYSSESQSLKSTLSLGPPFILLLFFFFLLCFYRGRSLLLRRRFSQRSSRHPVSIPLDFDIEIQNQSVWIIYLLDRQAIIIRPYVARSLIYFLILSFPSGQQTTGNYNLTGGQAFRVGHDFYIRAAIGGKNKRNEYQAKRESLDAKTCFVLFIYFWQQSAILLTNISWAFSLPNGRSCRRALAAGDNIRTTS